jgi:hypothetical protein
MHRERQQGSVRGWLVLAGVLLLGIEAAAPTRAADNKPDTSLALIPADAAGYSALLRNREQVDAVARSKAWGRIKELPAFQMAWQLVQAQYNEPDGKLADLRQVLEQQDNRDLLDVLGEAVAQEVFFYSGANWVDFSQLLMQMNRAQQFGPLMELLKNPDQQPDPLAGVRSLLRVLAANPDKIKVPDYVIGFKIASTKKAEAQLKRLEALLNILAMQLPLLQDRVKRVQIGGGDFLTLHLDGAMVPWDQIPFNNVAEAAGEFDGIPKRLQALKLTISLGVRDGYLLLAFGSSTDVLAHLGGKGKRLVDRPELKPLLQAAGRRLTSVAYASKALLSRTELNREDIDSLTVLVRHALEAADLPPDKRKAIEKDVAGLLTDLKNNIPILGASLEFSYLTERGVESHAYRHGEFPGLDGSKPLTLLQHVGGDPILAVVGRSQGTLEGYKTFSKWVRVTYGHVEPIVRDKMDKGAREKYEQISKAFLPLLKRLDEITATLLLPALADGQAGFVLDARWKSKQWHQAMPPTEKALPMLELAILVGVSDADLLQKAVQDYRKLINDTIAKVRELTPGDAPDVTLPKPETKTIPAATEGEKPSKLSVYRLPKEWGLDPQVAVTAGLLPTVGVLALSPGHAERLLASKPLKIDGGPLANAKRPLTGAAYFSWPAFVDAVTPWILFGLEQAQLEKNVPVLDRKQIGTLLDALKVFHVSTSTTAVEDGVLVTHSETVIRDR